MRKLLFSSLFTCLCFSASQAHGAGPVDGSVYGKINLSVSSADSSNDQWELNSNASRIGVKGKMTISDGLYAVYKAEFEMCVDDGDCKGQTFSQRNIMAGIQGKYGTIWAGKHDTPTKQMGKMVELFNDYKEGDLKNTFEGENRVSNVIAYSTPDMNGFSATVFMIPAEGNDIDGDGRSDDGLADGVSASAGYQWNNLYLGAAMDRDVDGQDLDRVVARYQAEKLTLGAMYQRNEDSRGSEYKDESGYLVSASYKLDKVTLKAQYGEIEDDADKDEEETMSIGADYKLSGKTKLFAYYTKNTDKDGGTGDESDQKAVGVGMEHKF